MVSLDEVSRGVMYIGILALLGALAAVHIVSALVAAILVLQYPAMKLYREYASAPDATDTTAAEE